MTILGFGQSTGQIVQRDHYEGLGYHVAFSAPAPSGGTVYYMDGLRRTFVELIPATPGMDEMVTRDS